MVAICPAAQVHTFTCYAEIRGLHTRKKGTSVYSLIRFVAVDIMELQRFFSKVWLQFKASVIPAYTVLQTNNSLFVLMSSPVHYCAVHCEKGPASCVPAKPRLQHVGASASANRCAHESGVQRSACVRASVCMCILCVHLQHQKNPPK